MADTLDGALDKAIQIKKITYKVVDYLIH